MQDLCRAITESRSSYSNLCKVIGNFKMSPINLLSGMPLEYDVMDTSNISDTIGLLNVLLAYRGLLSQKLHSTIYTELLNLVCKTCNNRDLLLREILRIDVSTFAAITGLSLLGTSTKTTTSYRNYFTHNLLPTLCQGSAKRTYINLEWKYVRGSDVRVNIESEDFVGVYTQIYRNMFGVGFNKGKEAAFEKHESEVGGMKLFSTPTVQNFVRLVCIGVKDLYATDITAQLLN